MSQFRKDFILDVHNNRINIQEWRWTEIEDKYHYDVPEGYKKGDAARKHFKWYDTVGKNKGEWAPNKLIDDADITIGDGDALEHSYLTPSDDVTNLREWQEFLAWKADKSKERVFTPGTYFVMGCTHVPFHNKPFFDAIIKLATDIQPTGLVLAGDFSDLNSLSSHDKGQKPIAPHVTLSWEYSESNLALDKLDNAADWKVKHYIYGNHEDRFWRHTRNVDVAKLGEALINPTVALNLKGRGYQVQEKWKEAKVFLGKHLEVIHGEFCNIHTAKKHIDAFRTSMLYFHSHRYQIYVEGNVGGFNLGWGGDVNSPAFSYATKAMKTSWKNAFGVVIIDELGGYHVQPVVWHNNRFYYNNKKYS